MFNWWFALLGIPLVELVGFIFHKFIDHGHLIKRIEYEHWKHHFKHYPPDNLRPTHSYTKVKAIEWKIFGPLVLIILFLLVPFEYALPIAVGGIPYAIIIWYFHRLFHMRSHFLSKNRYFIYLQKIHDLHHLDTSKNYTITNPVMDKIFGTFTSRVEKRKNTFDDFEERYKRET